MSKRKVLFLMTDSQRADMLGCYGNSDMHTPNLDRLAEQGIRFDKAYTTQPLCQPARAGIFLGCYPHSCASWSNSWVFPGMCRVSESVCPIMGYIRPISANGIWTEAIISAWADVRRAGMQITGMT